MRAWRSIVVAVAILGVTTGAFAGDLQQSAEKAAQEQARAKHPPMEKAYLVPGLALFGVGMGMTLYGWLHTSGGEFVSGQVTEESKTTLGAVGLAVAAAGGTLLFLGAQRAKNAASVTVGPDRVVVSKRLSW